MKSRSLFRNGRNVNGGCGYDNIPSSIWSPPSWPPSLALVVNWVLHWHPHSEQELGGRHLSDHSSPTKQAVLQRTEQVIDFMGFHKIEIFFLAFGPQQRGEGKKPGQPTEHLRRPWHDLAAHSCIIYTTIGRTEGYWAQCKNSIVPLALSAQGQFYVLFSIRIMIAILLGGWIHYIWWRNNEHWNRLLLLQTWRSFQLTTQIEVRWEIIIIIIIGEGASSSLVFQIQYRTRQWDESPFTQLENGVIWRKKF